MSETTTTFSRTIVIGLLLIFGLPPIFFSVSALSAGLPPEALAAAVVDQYAASRANLFVSGILGIVPTALLLILLWFFRKCVDGARLRAMAYGGLVGVAAILIWVNFEFWPLFVPGRQYPGFPHGLEFVIGPLFFAPPAMAAGVLAGWLASHNDAAT